MIDSEPVTEHAPESIRQLGSERNLRNEHQHLFALLQLLIDKTDIDFRFSRGGYAIEQGSEVLLHGCFDFGESLLLRLVELGQRTGRPCVGIEPVGLHHSVG